MEGLRELHLDGTSIKELSLSIEYLQGLVLLNLRNCKNLVHLPDNICNLGCLRDLNLCGCSNLFKLAVNLEKIESLWDAGVEIVEHRDSILFF